MGREEPVRGEQGSRILAGPRKKGSTEMEELQRKAERNCWAERKRPLGTERRLGETEREGETGRERGS